MRLKTPKYSKVLLQNDFFCHSRENGNPATLDFIDIMGLSRNTPQVSFPRKRESRTSMKSMLLDCPDKPDNDKKAFCNSAIMDSCLHSGKAAGFRGNDTCGLRRFVFFLFFVLFIFQPVLFAKSADIEYPDKIIIENIVYKASYETGRLFQKAYIEAVNQGTNEIIWKKMIYQITLDPIMEQDVQWVMITKVEVKDNKLVIVNQKEQKFSLDLETVEVERYD